MVGKKEKNRWNRSMMLSWKKKNEVMVQTVIMELEETNVQNVQMI